jgi:hypothetical protein
MQGESEGLFRTLRVAAIAMVVSIGVMAGASELLRFTGAPAAGSLDVVRGVFVLAALALVLLAQLIKHGVTAGRPAAVVAVVKAMIRNLQHGLDAHGAGVILLPVALSEAAAVLGLVLLVLSGGESRLLSHVMYLLALLSALAVLPDAAYWARVQDLSEAVRREAGRGPGDHTPG